VKPKRIVEICPAAMEDLRALLPRRYSRMSLMRLAEKLGHWTLHETHALDARVVELSDQLIFEMLVDDTFGFTCGMRLAFCEGVALPVGGGIWLIGMRKENETVTEAMIEVLRARREMVFS